jgi:hypothetical protein
VPVAPPLQQPSGQVLGPHVQTPAELHPCPLGQAAHVAPPFPQDDDDSYAKGMQTPPSQQPFGQELASQTQAPEALHACPLAHAAHASPPVPQEALDSDA